MMKNVNLTEKKLEICAGSYEDCRTAWEAGADRVELNSALSLGGLTPGLSGFLAAKKECGCPIVCMVRPRGAGFCYRDEEVRVMFGDAGRFLENGADRVLTSGQQKTAMEGISLIRHLQEVYGSRIEILAGSGLNAGNAAEMFAGSGVSQIHASCKGYGSDPPRQETALPMGFSLRPMRTDILW